jgi:hypothetical protein
VPAARLARAFAPPLVGVATLVMARAGVLPDWLLLTVIGAIASVYGALAVRTAGRGRMSMRFVAAGLALCGVSIVLAALALAVEAYLDTHRSATL